MKIQLINSSIFLQIKSREVILEDMDIAKVICDFVKANLIETLVVGASTRNGFVK